MNWDYHDRHTLYAALNFDRLRCVREGKGETVDFTKIDAFEEKLFKHFKYIDTTLNSHRQFLSNYLFGNPLVESIRAWYGLTEEYYQRTGRTTCTEVMNDVRAGLQIVLENLEELDRMPTMIPLQKIISLRDFCLKVSDAESAHRSTENRHSLRHALAA